MHGAAAGVAGVEPPAGMVHLMARCPAMAKLLAALMLNLNVAAAWQMPSSTRALWHIRAPVTMCASRTSDEGAGTCSRRQLLAASAIAVGGTAMPLASPAVAATGLGSSDVAEKAGLGGLVEVTDPATYSALAYAPQGVCSRSRFRPRQCSFTSGETSLCSPPPLPGL